MCSGRGSDSPPRSPPPGRHGFQGVRGLARKPRNPCAREGKAEQNRPIFLHLLGNEWLPSVPDVHARPSADRPARVADIACGAGWSSIALAKAYPQARVDGFDLDAPSVALAQANAAEHGVADRVSFQVRDVADPSLAGQYDLVMGFEMLHDLAAPVEALRVMRGMLAEGGAVVIMDERVQDQFTAPGDAQERLYYGFSTLCCLPAGMAVAIVGVQYRGTNNLPAGAKSTISAEIFFAGGTGPVVSRTFSGPLNRSFSYSTAAAATVWSACGAAFNLRINSSLRVTTTGGRTARASIRSQDVGAAFIYELRYRRC